MLKRFLLLICHCIVLVANCSAEEKFVVGELQGQLGNQMFIIAATTSLALDHGATPVFPSLLYKKDSNIPLNYTKIFYRLNTSLSPEVEISLQYYEPHYHYAPIPYQENMRILGWFQSEKFFKSHRQEIIELFSPDQEIKDYLNEKYGDIISDQNTVAVHFRSYEGVCGVHSVHCQYDLDYYQKAISLFPAESLFVVFSNDIEWCKKNFAGIDRKFRFIEGEPHYIDLYLMSMCRSNIICNSSFSWWAAYLNLNPDKVVVAPPHWVNPSFAIDSDVYPDEWIRIK